MKGEALVHIIFISLTMFKEPLVVDSMNHILNNTKY